MFTSLAQNPLLFSLVFVFFAELGDKTLYTVLVLATRFRTLPVLLGGWAAFIVQGFIAVLLGSLLGRLPSTVVHVGTGIVFLACGAWLLFKREEEEVDAEESASARATSMRQFVMAFVLVFLAEWGDATQIASAALVARLHAPVQVFIGATLGLWAGTVLAVVLGRVIGGRISTTVMRRIAGTLFCGFGVLALVRG
jgi:putative Ca2+/H+ antiporter (TMEM165/GDT1 family)